MFQNALSDRHGKSLLVSFSGLDGSGKSTQIDNLRQVLHDRGLTTRLLAFWDDVVVLSRYREGFVHRVYGSEKGIGAPDRPVNRRDKNVRKWYLSIIRHGLYLLDAVHLVIVVRRARSGGADVVILDRYIYDELANLPLSNSISRVFVRIVAALVPRPDVAYLLDADPQAARARKPEYPIDFLHECRRAYFLLAQVLGSMTIIPPLPLPEAKREVENAMVRVLVRTRTEAPTSLETVS
ncbi:MAG: thymidylate kinase [Candidatus Korobacteraceae bacterium]